VEGDLYPGFILLCGFDRSLEGDAGNMVLTGKWRVGRSTRHKANWVGWGLVTAISRTCFLLDGSVATEDYGKVGVEMGVERIRSSQFNTSQGKLGLLGVGHSYLTDLLLA
jgi:hypothetical protein